MIEDSLLGLGAAGFHRIAYTDWGDPAAEKVVVCVHGLTRNGRDFDRLAECLAEAGARVVCPDVVGRGRSDWQRIPRTREEAKLRCVPPASVPWGLPCPLRLCCPLLLLPPLLLGPRPLLLWLRRCLCLLLLALWLALWSCLHFSPTSSTDHGRRGGSATSCG